MAIKHKPTLSPGSSEETDYFPSLEKRYDCKQHSKTVCFHKLVSN